MGDGGHVASLLLGKGNMIWAAKLLLQGDKNTMNFLLTILVLPDVGSDIQ